MAWKVPPQTLLRGGAGGARAALGFELPQDPVDAAQHLGGGAPGEGQQQDASGIDAGRDQVGDAMDQRGRLARCPPRRRSAAARPRACAAARCCSFSCWSTAPIGVTAPASASPASASSPTLHSLLPAAGRRLAGPLARGCGESHPRIQVGPDGGPAAGAQGRRPQSRGRLRGRSAAPIIPRKETAATTR